MVKASDVVGVDASIGGVPETQAHLFDQVNIAFDLRQARTFGFRENSGAGVSLGVDELLETQ